MLKAENIKKNIQRGEENCASGFFYRCTYGEYLWAFGSEWRGQNFVYPNHQSNYAGGRRQSLDRWQGTESGAHPKHRLYAGGTRTLQEYDGGRPTFVFW